MIRINHLLMGLRRSSPIFQMPKYCVLNQSAFAPATAQSLISSIAGTILPSSPATEIQPEKSCYFFDLYLPDEDHPDYALWEQGILKSLKEMDRCTAPQTKIQTIAKDEPVRIKLSAENNPQYLELQKRALEAEKHLFEKMQNNKKLQKIPLLQ